MLNKMKIRLRRVDTNLSHLRAYQILKSRLLSVVVILIIVIALTRHFNADPINTLITTVESNNSTLLPGSLIANSDSQIAQFIRGKEQPQQQINPKLIFVNNKYPLAEGYRNIINAFDPDAFIQLPRHKKCEIYFKELYNKTPDWALLELESNFPYNGYIFDTKEQFINDQKNNLKNEVNPEMSDAELDEVIHQRGKLFEWEIKYQKAFEESYDTETYMSNLITNFRAFSQCYIDQSVPPQDQLLIDKMDPTITCLENEKRLFKFLTRKYPIYKRWNEEEVKFPPVMEKYLEDVNYRSPKSNTETKCFTRDLMNSYNGKGIIVSAADKHVDELSSLIFVLRALNNKLPIQIVHRGDLSKASQERLTNVSRSLTVNLDKISSFEEYVKLHYSHLSQIDLETIFPKQEIWYVDITTAVNPEDKRFISYGNKLLTLLLSSFEDSVLIDTDTVPFVDIEQMILGSEVYKAKGAFFFKDRQLYDRITGPELTFFKKLLPTRMDSAFFDIPELTNFTFNNRFFGEHYKHVQESGMVAINKRRHMRSVLSINLLQMWHAATTRVHGDKELFWLGFTIAGDEDYYMNKYGVGAVGQINPNSNRLLGDKDDSRRSKLKSHQLCTTHPAHLSGIDDHTLLWMNSGFITCKRADSAKEDIKMDIYKNVFHDEEELRKTYVGPLKISAILVPPPQERVINNELGEPASGWEVMFGCGGYLYCAYDVIGASENPFYRGTLVEYDLEQQLLYNYLGEIWVYYDKILGDK